MGILPLIYGLMKKRIPEQSPKVQALARPPWARTLGPRPMTSLADRGGQKTIFTLVAGFIDGEGNFQVFIDRNYLRAAFRIRLHIDDIATLYKIKEILGVGNVTIQGSNCLYTIGDLYSLKTVLLPLLDEYNLLTSKWLDYLDFKSVVNYLLYNRVRIKSTFC
jgi:hypothetical protein